MYVEVIGWKCAIVALLQEFKNIDSCPIEYSGFGYGELFKYLKCNDQSGVKRIQNLFLNFNEKEKFRIIRSLLRILCRELMIYPPSLFYPRCSGYALFGKNYQNFLKNDSSLMFTNDYDNIKESIKN